MKSRLGVGRLHKIFREARAEAAKAVAVDVIGEPLAADFFIKKLGPGAGDLIKYVEGMDAAARVPDLQLIVISGATTVTPAMKEAAAMATRLGIDKSAFIERREMSPAALQAKKVEAEIAFNLAPARVNLFSAGANDDEWPDIIRGLIERLKGKEVALAAAAPVFRDAVVQDIIHDIANENALIGAAGFIPGTDMPVLTANQVRMVLKIAAAFGVEMSVGRARELLAVVGGGFTFRAAARQAVGLVPVAGWVVKGAIAYSGTRTMGALAKKYFERLTGAEEKPLKEGL